MAKAKTKRPDYKKELDTLGAKVVAEGRLMSERMQALMNSNTQAVNDLRELVRLRQEQAVATTRFEQALAAIEKRLRDGDARSPGLASLFP
jgi:hypothetical protein